MVQIAFQHSAADTSHWGYTPGWQREIGFWNVLALVLGVFALAATRERGPRAA